MQIQDLHVQLNFAAVAAVALVVAYLADHRQVHLDEHLHDPADFTDYMHGIGCKSLDGQHHHLP